MFARLRTSDFIRTLALMRNRLWGYGLAIVIYSANIAFNFNIVTGWLKLNVLDASTSGNKEFLLRALLLAGLTFFLGTPLWVFLQYWLSFCIRRTSTEIRLALLERTASLPIGRVEITHSGNLLALFTSDLDTTEQFYVGQIQPLLMALFMSLIGLASIFSMSWQQGLLVVVLGLLLMVVNLAFARPMKRLSNEVQKRIGILTECLSDLLHGLQVTKMFQLQATVHRLYAQANQAMVSMVIARSRLEGFSAALNILIVRVTALSILALGAFLIWNGSSTIGAVWAVLHIFHNATYLFGSFGSFIAGIQKSLAGAHRIFNLLDNPAEPKKYIEGGASVSSVVSPAGDRALAVQGLSFRYPGNGADSHDVALENIDFSVERGQMVALVGPSGSGKSTIIKLLMGFYPLEQGSIAIDGRPISQYPLARLRDMLAYVPQDAYLFDGSIEENIRYGRPGATWAEIVAAARAAYAHEFILEQPNGYETLVGERGAKLSGGQRQRIAIARALLKNAPILLLDEATSALDSESEQEVQKALDVLMKGRTTLVIAHRLSTVEHADQIYVLDDGMIIEQGQHASLLEQKGLYAQLYELQFQAN